MCQIFEKKEKYFLYRFIRDFIVIVLKYYVTKLWFGYGIYMDRRRLVEVKPENVYWALKSEPEDNTRKREI